jgi:hypothetical protein
VKPQRISPPRLLPYLITKEVENSSVKANMTMVGVAKSIGHPLRPSTGQVYLAKAVFELQPHGYEELFNFMSETEMLPKYTKEIT